ncbi:hypothetical protein pneo_cds_563 [Pandoravirus neocaledonia]|uniref:F-box domain containing protein n=1 Tax=Pandoravirus neocaledonia TaxID=2107708 RepID=A0A2U7UCW0_9VIRU|nr:hypothetical protein pneo_cds_563 [Pandoravirus neocaledonia]AVK76170.1 hypothetical protein pneo_cds_563 [Pandoravirus neocaledonia]
MDRDVDAAFGTICALPAEMMARILDMLKHGDFCRARSAHRCFCVHTADEVWRGRRVHHWLRLSPEIVCKAGRLDILAFLDARHRLPLRAHELLRLAVKHGHCAVVRFLASRRERLTDMQERALPEQDRLIDPHDIVRIAIRRENVGMVRALCECWGPPFCLRVAISLALKMDKTQVARSLIDGSDEKDAIVLMAFLFYEQATLIRRDEDNAARRTDQLSVLTASAPANTIAMALLAIAMTGVRREPVDQQFWADHDPVVARRRKRYADAIGLIASVMSRDVIDAALRLAAATEAHEAEQLLIQAIHDAASLSLP